MFINPKTAIEKGWIKFPEWMNDEQRQKCIQPNAIDFTIDALFELERTPASLHEDKQYNEFCKCTELKDVNGGWMLQHNRVYDAISNFYVEVPDGVACQLINRSSFNRVGIHLNCGLYDTGYKGNIGFTLCSRHTSVFVEANMRVGQIIFIASDSEGSYSGFYNTVNGEHWAEGKGA